MARGFQHFGPSSRVGSCVLHHIREAWRRTRSGEKLSPVLDVFRYRYCGGILDEGLQKQLTRAGVKRRNYN